MPMHIYFDNDEKTIIRCDSSGSWTWDEYHEAIEEIAAMIRGVSHRVDLITVPDNTATNPPGSPQPHFERALKLYPPNMGLNVLVSDNFFARAILSLWRRMPGNKLGNAIVLVPSVEEAYALVARESAKGLV